MKQRSLTDRRTWMGAAGALGMGCCLLWQGGCGGGSSGNGHDAKSVQTLTSQDFVSKGEPGSNGAGNGQTAAAPGAPATPTTAKPRDRYHPAPEPHTPSPDETIDAAALVGTPKIPPPEPKIEPAGGESASDSPPPTGDAAVVESLVGQINGRAVFASEILEPLDARLRASAARTKDQRRWSADTKLAITQQLRQVIEEELILAEARSALSQDQKAGLFQFLNRIQETMVAQQGGSTVAADEASRASSGRTLSQKTRDKLDEILIAEEIRQRVGARVLVTWRQIQLEYERQYDKYNPKPIAVLRLVAVPTAKAEAVDKIKSQLAAGEKFGSLADAPENVLKGDPSTINQPVSGTLAQTKLFDIPALNEAAQKLEVGQVAGPIENDKMLWWVQLEKIEHPPAVSLYDAQLEIEAALLEKRKATELSRYFERLKARGNFSKVDDMVDRLMKIATDRYWPQKQ